MKHHFSFSPAMIAALGAAALVGGCGGGGGGDDTAGSPTAFSVVPSEITLSVPEGNPGGLPEGRCYGTTGGAGGRIFVYGGAAPYRIDNTSPAYVVVDRTTVAHRGDFFQVDFTGNCTSSAILVIVDALDRQVHVTLVNEPVPAASTP